MAVYGDSNTEPATENQPTDPKSYYAAGKAAAENYVSLFDKLGLDTTIFRLFIVYGPNQHLGRSQGMVSIYLSFLFDEDVLTIKGSLERVRDCIYIDDVVDVWMQARDNPQTYGETYNVGRGERVTVREILETMKTCYGEPDYPMKVEAGTPCDQFAIYADTSKLKKDLNWSPEVSLEEGLNRMIEFYTDLS
jgi:UDP-glucose 4-epimerase